MMRKLLPLVIVSAILLTPLYPVYAQSSPAPVVKRITRPAVASAAAKLDAAKQRLEGKKEIITDRMDNLKEKLATRAAELKAKLAKFRDKNKANRVEMINTNLAAVNTRRTTQMQASLDRISQVVAKLKTWAAEQEAAGKDMTDVKKVIADTEAAWTQASSAVKDQTDNDYTIAVNTESTVKTDAMKARDSLHTDLMAVHDKIINVRQTLATALSSWGANK